MPLGRVGQWGGSVVAHGKRLIHTVIFSMPSANDTAASLNATAASLNATASAAVSDISDANATAVVGPKGPDASLFGGYMGSGYDVTLIFMAILFNRIHNIVHRERRAPAPPPASPGWRGALREHVRRALTSPSAPRWLRLPGIIALVRAWVLFTVVVLQIAQLWPVNTAAHLAMLEDKLGADAAWAFPLRFVAQHAARAIDRLGAWGGGMEMSDVCWTVFINVCFGLTMGALATGLDRERDVALGFNLFGFSFLLHVYASPLTHVRNNPPASEHSRPDVHALLQLWISLTELTWLEANELSTTLRRNMLLPTGVCGFLALAAFAHSLWTGQMRFPSFTFLTHLMALVLSIIIACTVVVRGFTLLFTYGYIPSPVWQHLLPHEGAMPSVEDEVGVALLKLGVACIEATQYSGLRNELAPVEEAQHPQVRLSADGTEMTSKPGGGSGFGARVDKVEAVALRDPNAESPYQTQLSRFWNALVDLGNNLFWASILSTKLGRELYRLCWRMYHMRWWYGPRSWRLWRSDAWAAPPVRHVPREPPLLLAMAIAKARRRAIARGRTEMGRITASDRASTPSDAPSYDQVLRGEVEFDDNDGDDDDGWESDGTSASAETVSEGEEDEALLYRDLVRGGTADDDGEGDLQPILMAHLTSSSASPLTRRRYAAMVAGPVPSQPSFAVSTAVNPLHDAIVTRRSEAGVAGVGADEWDEERRRSCVVCMVQTRDVILWPCRCLLMCNDCRESLASRVSAKDHACPNCRTKVEGYSRIYVP